MNQSFIIVLVTLVVISGMFTPVFIIGVVAIVFGQNNIAVSDLDTLKEAMQGVIRKIKK